MSRRGKKIAKLQQNYLKKGRGQGVGQEYIPFIQAHDNKIASEGWLTRHKGWKTKRIHHTLSEHERKYLYYLEWLDGVVDIREQWPLLPLEKTVEIAKQLGVEHANIDGEPVVMTTDFRISLRTTSGQRDVIRTIKPIEKLSDRTLELFEIERRFFAEESLDWCIITENKIPVTVVANVEWMCEAKYLDTRPGMDEELVALVSDDLYQVLVNDGGKSAISKLCLNTDKNFGLQNGTCMFVLQYMLANKKWATDMNKRIREFDPIVVYSNEMSITSINLA